MNARGWSVTRAVLAVVVASGCAACSSSPRAADVAAVADATGQAPPKELIEATAAIFDEHEAHADQPPHGGVIVPLIKPQFELRKEQVGKGGVVRDAALHAQAVEKIRTFVIGRLAQEWSGCIESPILGGEGNKEFLACLRVRLA